MPPDAIELQTLDETRDKGQETTSSDAGKVTPIRATTPQPQEIPELDVPEAEPGVQACYDAVLATTRVYDRVKDRNVDALTSVSTTRSHPWSVLSGISMAELSVIAVISLPLYEPELRRFRHLVSPVNQIGHDLGVDDETFNSFARPNPHVPSYLFPQFSRGISRENWLLKQEFLDHYGLHWNSGGTPGDHSLKSIERQLNQLVRNPPPMCTAQPIGDDLVCLFARVTCRSADKYKYNWQGVIMGPVSRLD